MFSTIGRKPRDATIRLAFVLLAIIFTFWTQCIFAATNEATDPGGGSFYLQPSGPVTVNSIKLALVTQARDLDGQLLPDGAKIVPGQEIYYLLYVDNPTPVTAQDLQLTDIIDTNQLKYIAGTLQMTTVPSGSSDAVIWTGAWSSMSDDPGTDDVASAVQSGASERNRIAIGAVAGQANMPVNIDKATIKAFRFRVKVR